MLVIATPPGRVDPFAAPLLPLCPAPVRAASEALTDALRRIAALSAELATAKDTLAAASVADEAAARAAVAAGKTPPAGSTAEPTDAVDRAERAVAAAAQLAVQAQAEYLATVAEQFDELQANLTARQDAVRAEASAALDILAGAIREKLMLDGLQKEMHLGTIRARRPHFRPTIQRRRKDPADDLLAPLRAKLGERGGGSVLVTA